MKEPITNQKNFARGEFTATKFCTEIQMIDVKQALNWVKVTVAYLTITKEIKNDSIII